MHDENSLRQLIVYACPTGPLAEAIEQYFVLSRERFGPNSAHTYPPHISLTGFFHDSLEATPIYNSALAAALDQGRHAHESEPIRIREYVYSSDWHGLVIDSPWLRILAVNFIAHAVSPTRRDHIRTKDWLHLSLAYGFAADQHEGLAALAGELIDPTLAVGWELRFYEQHDDGSWICHGTWSI